LAVALYIRNPPMTSTCHRKWTSSRIIDLLSMMMNRCCRRLPTSMTKAHKGAATGHDDNMSPV
jgi:hypothetical protein